MMLLLLIILQLLNLPDWVQHESLDGGYSILVPRTLETSVRGIETEVGTIEYHTHYLKTENDSFGHAFFSVSYCDYPEGSFPPDSATLIAEFFEVTMEQSAAAVNGELIYSDQKFLNEYPGRFWRIHYDNNLSVMKTKAYLVGDRFYVVQIATRETHAQEQFVDRYLDSFRLLEK